MLKNAAAFAFCLLWLLAGPASAEMPVWGFAVHGLPTARSLSKLEADTGIRPQMVLIYIQWPSKDELAKKEFFFPEESLRAISSIGAVPCITWEPMYINGQRPSAIPLGDITGGLYDGYIEFFRNKICSFGTPIVIRFAHEMNLSSYHWGTGGAEYGPQSPDVYKKMFIYVAGRFRGARNALWAFCPNHESVPRAVWNSAVKYYPGDEFVDVMGMDGYGEEGCSFEETFANIFSELEALAPGKPVVVFETASSRDKESWAAQALGAASKWGLPAILWFQENKEEDWPIRDRDVKIISPLISSESLRARRFFLDLIQKKGCPLPEKSNPEETGQPACPRLSVP
jgi:hypothetical protein